MQQIELKLKEQGYTKSEIYNHDEYKNAWVNFRKYLEDNNLLEFVELK